MHHQEAKQQNAAMLFLPECCSFIGTDQAQVGLQPYISLFSSRHMQASEVLSLCYVRVNLRGVRHMSLSLSASRVQTVSKAEPLSGAVMQRYQKLAKDTNLWLSIGGFQVQYDILHSC